MHPIIARGNQTFSICQSDYSQCDQRGTLKLSGCTNGTDYGAMELKPQE